MRVAVACDGLVVAPYFAQCRSYMIYAIERGKVVGSRNLPAFDQSVGGIAKLLQDLEVDALIVGRIDAEKASGLRSSGVDLVTDAQDDPLLAVRDYLASIFSLVED